MEGIPTDDRWYWVRGCHLSISGPNSAAWIRANADELQDAEFFPIPPPPDDGEYAYVPVEVKRNAEGKRTCFRCGIYEQCDKQVWMNEDNTIMLRPGPDCPLGSD